MAERTILFCDQVGSTALLTQLGDRHAEEVRRDVFDVLTTSVEMCRGRVVKKTGDGIMAVFPGSVAMAVRSAERMQRGAEALDARDAEIDVRLRIGVSCGAVVFDEDDWYGAAVNLAARLCGSAEPGQTLLTGSVSARLTPADVIEVVDAGSRVLKGFSEPVRVFEVTRAPAASGSLPPLPIFLTPGGPTSFAGRDAELTRIVAAWTDAAAGLRSAVVVQGGPGAGTSRLLAEAALRLHGQGATVLFGRCGSGDPQGPFGEMLRWYAGGIERSELPDPDTSEAPRLARAVPLYGLRVAIDPEKEVHGGPTPKDLVDEIENWLVRAAERAPLVLVVDELDRATRAEASIITQVLTGPVPGRCLVLVGVRSAPGTAAGREVVEGIVDKFRDLPGTLGIDLGRLGEGAVRAIVTPAIGGAGAQAGPISGVVAAQTAGHAGSVADAVSLILDHREDLFNASDPAGATRRLIGSLAPYRGLIPYGADDASAFHGREGVLAWLVDLVRAGGFTAVVGSSGSGKSSLIAAGVLPRLNEPDGQVWHCETITPGPQPLESIDAAVRTACTRLANRGAPQTGSDGTAACLFIDQFEECFTLCEDEREREQFFDRVVGLSTAPDGFTSVIIAMRGDFFGRGGEHRGLAAFLESHTVLLGPMAAEDMRAVIERPAMAVGLDVEAGFAEVVLADVSGRPGGLPLLSHALYETWIRRRGATLDLRAYREAGGVHGAIARTADQVFEQFTAEEQAVAREILLRLAAISETGEPTARRITEGEMPFKEGQRDLADRVLDVMTGRRLLIPSDGSIEVAHEALLREWPRFRAWIEEDGAHLALLRQIGEDALAWDRAGRLPTDLWRGPRLAAGLDLYATRLSTLTAAERAFLEAGSVDRDLEEARERQTNRRLRRRLRLVGVALVLALVAGGAAVANGIRAGRESTDAKRQTAAAEAAGRLALARQLAAQAQSASAEGDHDLGLLLAAEAVELDANVEAKSALFEALRSSDGLVRHLPGGAEALDSSGDGRVAAVLRLDGGVVLWDLESGSVLRSLDLEGGTNPAAVVHIELDEEGRRLAVMDITQQVRLFDLESGERLAEIDPCSLGCGSESRFFGTGIGGARIAFSADGRWMAVAGPHEVFLADVGADGGEARLLSVGPSEPLGDGSEPPLLAVAFDPSGERLLAAGPRGLAVWRVGEPGAEMLTIPSSVSVAEVVSIDVHSSRGVHTMDAVGNRIRWDLATRQGTRSTPLDLSTEAGEHIVAVDWDLGVALVGPPLAEGFDDRLHDVSVRRLADGASIATVPWRANTSSLPGGGQLLTLTDDAVLQVEFGASNVTSIPLDGTGGANVALLSGGGSVAASWDEAKGGPLRLFDIRTGRQIDNAPTLDVAVDPGLGTPPALSAGGRRIAYETEDRAAVVIWDLIRGRSVGEAVPVDGIVTAIAVADDGPVAVLSTKSDNTIMLTVGDEGTPPRSVECTGCDNSAIALSPDLATIAVARGVDFSSATDFPSDTDTATLLFDSLDLRMAGVVETNGPFIGTVGGADTSLLVAARDGTSGFALWKRSSSEAVLRGPIPTRYVPSVALQPGGALVASSTEDGVRLWDLEAAAPLATELASRPRRLPTTDFGAIPVAFSADGAEVIWTESGGSNGEPARVFRYPVEIEGLLVRACERANRRLTDAEVDRFLGGSGRPPLACTT